MIDGSFKVTPRGGSQTDYPDAAQSISIRWLATTDLPTCEVVLNSRAGRFVTLPLFSQTSAAQHGLLVALPHP